MITAEQLNKIARGNIGKGEEITKMYDKTTIPDLTKCLRIDQMFDENDKSPKDVTFTVTYHNFWTVINSLRTTDGTCPICGRKFKEHHGYLEDFDCIINQCMFYTDFEGGG